MKLKKIFIENFRCFERLTLDLHPNLTVLIAPNGAGKTTLIDALRASVWPLVKAFDLGSQTGKSATIQIDDVRKIKRTEGNMEPVTPARIVTTGSWDDSRPDETWEQTREKIKCRTNTIYDARAKALTRYGQKLQKNVRKVEESTTVDLPLIVYLGTGRLWYQGRYTSKPDDKKLDQGAYSRTWGYRDCITALSNYKQFEDWYTWICKSHDQDKENPHFLNAINVVQSAVNEITQQETGWRNIIYSEGHQQQIILSHPENGEIPLSMLSDGLRNTVVMVADIAFRCIKLNPHFGADATRKTSGIAMIDEVDMFLHPAWQQTIIGSLQRAFPQIQFIVTTHSPQVLTTVPAECIRCINWENSQVRIDIPNFSLGAEPQQLLDDILGVNPRPNNIEIVKELYHYLQLISEDKWDDQEALTLRINLDNIYGSYDPVLMKADMDIRLRQRRRTSK